MFEDFGRKKLKDQKLPKVELDEKSQKLLENLLKDVKQAKLESKVESKVEPKPEESESCHSSFQIVDHSDYTSTNSFSIVDAPETENDSFSIVNYSDAGFEIDS